MLLEAQHPLGHPTLTLLLGALWVTWRPLGGSFGVLVPHDSLPVTRSVSFVVLKSNPPTFTIADWETGSSMSMTCETFGTCPPPPPHEVVQNTYLLNYILFHIKMF